MSLRSILASEGLIVTAGLSDKAQLAVMKKYNHPSLKSTRTFLPAVSTVYHEFEVTNPVEFKSILEDPDQFGGLPTMPLDFYRELVAAVKLDEKSYWDKKKLAGLEPARFMRQVEDFILSAEDEDLMHIEKLLAIRRKMGQRFLR